MIVLFLCVVALILGISCKSKVLTFRKYANSSSGKWWECSLSNDMVLRQINYKEIRYIFNLGPGYMQQWKFRFLQKGEVIMFWQMYSGGGDKIESYSVTYSFDEKGNYSIIADSRKRAKEDARKLMKSFMKKDAEEIFDFFCEDIKNNYKEETMQEIEKGLEFISGTISSCRISDDHVSNYEKQKDFNTYFWRSELKIEDVCTDKGKYEIIIYNMHMWSENPQYQGINIIKIWDGQGGEIIIGKDYYIEYPE